MDTEGRVYHWTFKNEEKKRDREWMGMMKWNGMRGLEWKWIGMSVMEVAEKKNGMEMDGNEWIEIIDANKNEKQIWVVMKVMEVKEKERRME